MEFDIRGSRFSTGWRSIGMIGRAAAVPLPALVPMPLPDVRPALCSAVELAIWAAINKAHLLGEDTMAEALLDILDEQEENRVARG